MRLLTLLSFQAFVIALLCSPASTEKKPVTLDEVLKALGSMYQDKLYSVRDDAAADGLENVQDPFSVNESDGPYPVSSLQETVTVPRYHYCLYSFPYCVTFYGSIIVLPKPLQQAEVKRKNIRNAQNQLCLKDIKLGECNAGDAVRNFEPIVDVRNLEIPDFCFPGKIKLDGELHLLRKLIQNTTVYVQMDPSPRSGNESNEIEVGYFYNACDLLEGRDGCPKPKGGGDFDALPCKCDMNPAIYGVHDFEKTIKVVDFFNLGKRSGFVVVYDGPGKNCFTFSFTGYYPGS